MTDLAEEALNLIQSHRQGILQSELWKQLNIDSRKCSRIVKRLLDAGQIERIEFRNEGIKTYLLRAKKKAADPSLILAGCEILPCIRCELECIPEECPLLLDWIYQLALEEYEE
ncbi:MAG: winged helix-turn-helix transcriptional regulator [Methanomicrobiaceae archaeon]|uniref:B-block binding subunit of TFIIIC domain-containing protein n=1 Tax=hydrocarbon metagenome TaxID=938273 RepID=A0A0W8FIF3_9ZZZZ|nr:winged helix-turn-helix transcriptional regulator [Methanomicrobiaceae archaeon]MDD5419748.1 winged helix-turn-helix transcriptional regulator [Methanomicrobiaceae archaeon]